MSAEAVQLAGCVIQDPESRVLLIHRNQAGLKQWEIPGCIVGDQEHYEKAIVRGVDSQLGIAVALRGYLGEITFNIAKHDFKQRLYLAEIALGSPRPTEDDKYDMITYQNIEAQDSCNGSRFSAGYTAFCEAVHTGTINIYRNKKTT